MNKIKLSDLTEFGARFCSASNGSLTMCIISELGFMDIATLFCDIEKTSTISFEYGQNEDTYCGYTRPVEINNAREGEYIIILLQEV